MNTLSVQLEYEKMHTIYSDWFSLPVEQYGIAKSIKITYNCEDRTVPQIFYRKGDKEFEEVPREIYTYDLQRKTVNFEIYKLYKEQARYDWKIVVGDYVYQTDSLEGPICYGLTESTFKTEFRALNDAISDLAETEFFKRNISVTIPNVIDLNASKDDFTNFGLIYLPAFKNIKIVGIFENESIEVNVPKSYGLETIQKIKIPDSWLNASIKIFIIDEAERVYEFVPNQNFFTRANSLEKTGQAFQFITSIKPYSNIAQIENAIPVMGIPTGSSDVEIKYVFGYGPKTEEHKISYNNNVIQGFYTFQPNDLNNLLITLFKTGNSAINNQYPVDLKVFISSGFEILEFNSSFFADFIESPYIQNEKNLTLAYRTSTGFSSITNDDGIEPRMYNRDEVIQFTTPSFQDSNEDIQTCIIEVAKVNLTDNINSDIANLSNATYTVLANYTYNTQNIYNYTLPFYSKNEILCFRARVRDSKGNYSDYSLPSTYIIACRTVSPEFVSSNFLCESISEEITKFSFNFQIQDLGGSATSNGWNEDFYRIYKNFERTVQDQNGKIELKVELGENQRIFKSNTIIKEYGSGFTYMNFSGEKAVEINIKKTGIMYARFTFIIYYGSNNRQVSSISQIYTIGEVPTVSYRKNQVGINVAEIPSDAILTIDAVTGKDKIFIRNLTNYKTIEIDLNTGYVKGLQLNGPTVQGGNFFQSYLRNVDIREGIIQGVTIKDSKIEDLPDPILDGETINNLILNSPSVNGGEIRGAEDNYMPIECALINMATIQNATMQSTTIQFSTIQDTDLYNVNIDCGSWDDPEI